MISDKRQKAIQGNMEKSLKLASVLFPDEEWVFKEQNIYVAKSRLAMEYREPANMEERNGAGKNTHSSRKYSLFFT